MYSKNEVYLTVVLALSVSYYFNPQQTDRMGVQDSVLTIADGGHPPPPDPPSPSLQGVEVIQSDGGHPPPPDPPSASLQHA